MTAQAAQTPGPPAVARSSSRRLLIAAIVLVAAWWIVLSLLALFTANPITLNRDQILRADAVVTATVDQSPSAGRVTVTRVWKGDRQLGGILVENLRQAGARAGRTYLLPLSHVDDRADRVTATTIPGGPPLIYPATAEAEQQLTQILTSGSGQDK